MESDVNTQMIKDAMTRVRRHSSDAYNDTERKCEVLSRSNGNIGEPLEDVFMVFGAHWHFGHSSMDNIKIRRESDKRSNVCSNSKHAFSQELSTHTYASVIQIWITLKSGVIVIKDLIYATTASMHSPRNCLPGSCVFVFSPGTLSTT